mmetsp:Transcript_30961/g.73845  ORF Transcript_30961/g.73845 Transcript_30961/m.73845 type:complete len:561 (+) Transcript_30961:1078-2760(+)
MAAAVVGVGAAWRIFGDHLMQLLGVLDGVDLLLALQNPVLNGLLAHVIDSASGEAGAQEHQRHRQGQGQVRGALRLLRQLLPVVDGIRPVACRLTGRHHGVGVHAHEGDVLGHPLQGTFIENHAGGHVEGRRLAGQGHGDLHPGGDVHGDPALRHQQRRDSGIARDFAIEAKTRIGPGVGVRLKELSELHAGSAASLQAPPSSAACRGVRDDARAHGGAGDSEALRRRIGVALPQAALRAFAVRVHGAQNHGLVLRAGAEHRLAQLGHQAHGFGCHSRGLRRRGRALPVGRSDGHQAGHDGVARVGADGLGGALERRGQHRVHHLRGPRQHRLVSGAAGASGERPGQHIPHLLQGTGVWCHQLRRRLQGRHGGPDHRVDLLLGAVDIHGAHGIHGVQDAVGRVQRHGGVQRGGGRGNVHAPGGRRDVGARQVGQGHGAQVIADAQHCDEVPHRQHRVHHRGLGPVLQHHAALRHPVAVAAVVAPLQGRHRCAQVCGQSRQLGEWKLVEDILQLRHSLIHHICCAQLELRLHGKALDGLSGRGAAGVAIRQEGGGVHHEGA